MSSEVYRPLFNRCIADDDAAVQTEAQNAVIYLRNLFNATLLPAARHNRYMPTVFERAFDVLMGKNATDWNEGLLKDRMNLLKTEHSDLWIDIIGAGQYSSSPTVQYYC